MSETMTLKQIIREVSRLDPKLSPDDSAFHSAVLLLAALQQGQEPLKLAQFTGYSLPWIDERVARLQAAGIWKSGKTYADWFTEGSLDFWMDVAVAEGIMERAKGVSKTQSGRRKP